MIASHHQSRQQRSLLSGAPLGKKGAVNVCSVSAGDKHEKTTNFLITDRRTFMGSIVRPYLMISVYNRERLMTVTDCMPQNHVHSKRQKLKGTETSTILTCKRSRTRCNVQGCDFENGLTVGITYRL